MSVSVSMPQLGESVTEGTVTRWLKKEGERVEADEPLLEVSTDKVDTEIPSPVAGILRGITVAEDETVAVGAELAVIDENGAQPAAEDAGGAEPEAQAEPGPRPSRLLPPLPRKARRMVTPQVARSPAFSPQPRRGTRTPRRAGTRVAGSSRPPCTSSPPPTRPSATGRRARRTPRVSRSLPPGRRRTRGSPEARRRSRPRRPRRR